MAYSCTEIVELSSLCFYENIDALLLVYPVITDLTTVDLETNGATCITVELPQKPTFEREIINSGNYIQAFQDTFTFNLQGFAFKTELELLRNSRKGFIAVAETNNGESWIFQTPVFISKKSELPISKRSTIVELSYRVPTKRDYLNLGETIEPSPFLQELFKKNGILIDFVGNVVYDNSVSLINSSLLGGYGLEMYGYSRLPLSNSAEYTKILDYDLDHTIISTYLVYSPSTAANFWYCPLSGFTDDYGIRVKTTNIELFINNSVKGTFNRTATGGKKETTALRKTANTFEVWLDGVLVITHTAVYSLNSDTTNFIVVSPNSPIIHGLTIIQQSLFSSSLLDSEILSVGNNAIKAIQLAELKLPNSNCFNLAEGVGSSYEKFTGVELIKTPEESWVFLDEIESKNQYTGFELYTLDIDNSIRKYMPLKNDGTSHGIVVTGYTSQGIVLQDGFSFLDCGSLLDNTAVGAILDPNGFYDLPVSFGDIATETEVYIDKDLVGDIVNSLRILPT